MWRRCRRGEAQYIIRLMRVWTARPAVGLLVLMAIAAAGCSNPLAPKYEYEEQMYLKVDGSATVLIDASLAALVALRNLPVDRSSAATIDRDRLRALLEAAGCGDVRVGQPWVRQGRRFVQVTIQAADVNTLHACGPLSWSTYVFEKDDGGIHFKQTVGAPTAADPGAVNWNGSELVAFKLHSPSKVFFHNVKRLRDGKAGKPERGNILTWEQRFSDRRAGVPVEMEVRIGADSILFRTLWLFGGAFVAAVIVLVTLIAIAIRRAKRRPALGARPVKGH